MQTHPSKETFDFKQAALLLEGKYYEENEEEVEEIDQALASKNVDKANQSVYIAR